MTQDRVLTLLGKMTPINAAKCLSRMDNEKAIPLLEKLPSAHSLAIMSAFDMSRADTILLQANIEFSSMIISKMEVEVNK